MDEHQQEELFFEQLKDQFVFFYAVTVAAMQALKQARSHYQKDAASKKKT